MIYYSRFFRKLLPLSLAVLLALSLLSGCSPSPKEESAAPVAEESSVVNESDDSNDVPEEIRAYQEFLSGDRPWIRDFDDGSEGYVTENWLDGNELPWKYTYIDLNDDGVYEMLISSGIMHVVCWDGTDLHALQHPFYSSAKQFVTGNKELIQVDEFHWDRQSYTVCRLNQDNKIEKVIHFEHWEMLQGDDVTMSYAKVIGDYEEITEDDYEEITEDEFHDLNADYVGNIIDLKWNELTAESAMETIAANDAALLNNDSNYTVSTVTEKAFEGREVPEEIQMYREFLLGKRTWIVYGEEKMSPGALPNDKGSKLEYAYTDLNGDGVYEMLYTAGFLSLVAWDGSNVCDVPLPFYSASRQFITQNKELVQADVGHSGRQSYTVYRFNEKNELEFVAAFERTDYKEVNYWRSYSLSEENEPDDYEEISEEEFNNLYNAYVDTVLPISWNRISDIPA